MRLILKILAFPFVLVKTVLMLLLRILRLGLGTLIGGIRFLFSRTFGVLLGAGVALFLGKKFLDQQAQEEKASTEPTTPAEPEPEAEEASAEDDGKPEA